MTESVALSTVQDLVSTGEAEIKTGPFGTQLHASDYVEEGTPVINVRNIGLGVIRPEKLEYISNHTVQRLRSHLLEPGDIVFGRKGAVERHVYVRSGQDKWFQGSDCIRLRVKSAQVDTRFLSYSFLTEDHKSWMLNQGSHGATMASLNQDIIGRIPLRVPALPVQRRIADILSAYDDLIETNARRIALLEELARSLYQEWFVRFRFPGHEGVELVESAVGLVPEGWEVGALPDVVEIDPSTRVPKEGEKPFVPMASLSTTSMLLSDIESRTGNSGSKFRNGDTLFARITPCLENGKTGYVQFLPSDDAVAFGSTEFIVLRSKQDCPEFVYLLARSDEFRDHAIKSMTGATGRQRVQARALEQFPIVVPDGGTLARFHDNTAPIFSQINLLARKNDNLRQTRDILLPKLISGEIDLEPVLAIQQGSRV